jgi:hypothetical protein
MPKLKKPLSKTALDIFNLESVKTEYATKI